MTILNIGKQVFSIDVIQIEISYVTDFYLDHIDAKHLLADVKDGHIVISEKADSDDSKDQDKAEK